ncbi:MAG: hypothetical protein ACO1RT_17225 [Planctomycetaceae bacterium]
MLRLGLAACAVLVLFGSAIALGGEPLLKPNDTLALVGGTLVERMQSTAALENELHCRRPDWKLRVRNLGWSGDDVHGFARKVFETDPQRGFERLINDLRIAQPTVALVAYGFTEATGGPSAADAFEPGLRKLVAALGDMQCRVVLMRPIKVPGVRVEDYEQQLQKCVAAVDRVGQETGSAVVQIQCDAWTEDGLAPSAAGYQSIGEQLATELVGGEACAATDGELSQMIIEKNRLFFHRHRPQNETYLMLFRKHEQGNNAVELPQFDPLVDALDQKIWNRMAKPQ